jgi:hypothetical protein
VSTASTRTAQQIRELGDKARALLRLLSDGRWHRQDELAEVAGFRYGARLWDLKQAGHRIEKVALEAREYRYRLLPPERLL